METEGVMRRVVLEGQFHNAPAILRMLPESDVRPRVQTNLRPINEFHVEELVESIAELGLITPIATDKNLRLVAGAHRLEAIRRLIPLRRWEGPIMVRVFTELDSEADPGRARLIEIAENDKRRDYTPAEVRTLACWLRERGYSKDHRGRPRKGERALVPALSVVVGKSHRRIQQILAAHPEQEELPDEALHSLATLDRAMCLVAKAISCEPCHAASRLRRELEILRPLVAATRMSLEKKAKGSSEPGSLTGAS